MNLPGVLRDKDLRGCPCLLISCSAYRVTLQRQKTSALGLRMLTSHKNCHYPLKLAYTNTVDLTQVKIQNGRQPSKLSVCVYAITGHQEKMGAFSLEKMRNISSKEMSSQVIPHGHSSVYDAADML